MVKAAHTLGGMFPPERYVNIQPRAWVPYAMIPTNSPIYYVDATGGNDSNRGIFPDEAWQTIAKVNATAFQPGDQILFKRGETWRNATYNSGSFLTVPASGTSGHPITFGAYGSGVDPILCGAFIITGGWDVHDGAIYVTHDAFTIPDNAGCGCWVNNVRLKRVALHASLAAGTFFLDDAADDLYVWLTDGTDPTGHVMEFTNCLWGFDTNAKSYLAIDHITATKFRNSAFTFRVAGVHDVTVTNCTATWSNIRGFDLGGTSGSPATNKMDVVLYDCTASDNLGEGFWIGFATRCGAVRWTSYNNGLDRTSKGYPGVTIAGACATIAVTAVDCYIRNGHGYNNGASYCLSNEYVAIEGDPPLRSIFDSNLIELQLVSSTMALLHGTTCTFINNVLLNVGAVNMALLAVANGADDTRIYHNTFRQKAQGAVVLLTAGTNIKVKNNIFKADDVSNTQNISLQDAAETGLELDYNSYGGSRQRWRNNVTDYTSWATWLAAIQAIIAGAEAHSIDVADPAFVNEGAGNYHLQATSPCIGVGDATVGVLTDYDGVVRSSPPAIGCYEYS